MKRKRIMETIVYTSEEEIYNQIKQTILNAKQSVNRSVNEAMVQAYWSIGKVIYDTIGTDARTNEDKQLLDFLSKKLENEFGKGFDKTNLRKMRQFYSTFPNRDALRLDISWTHYRSLMKVADPNARNFYLEECAKSGWSTRQLDRQINTMYYQRLLSSKDKKSVSNEIQVTEPKPEYETILKDPYVLEFLELPKNDHYYESDLEEALIDHLQKFLLELGRGFAFIARQKHIVFDGRHFYIDLVFYNYILKCFVLIDLKTHDLNHQDIGQMQMYVNYYTRELMNEGDNPPVGLLLCADKSDSILKYTLPEGNDQIFAAKYLPYLPTEEELRKELNLDDFIHIDD